MASKTFAAATGRALRAATPCSVRGGKAFRTMTVPQAKRSGGESDKQSQHESQQGGQLQHRGKDEEMGVMSPSSFFEISPKPIYHAGPLMTPFSAMSALSPMTRGPLSIDRLLHDIEDDFKLFSNLFGASDAPDTSPMAKTDRLWAAVDVSESDKEFDLRVDVPGLSEKDINIKVDNNMLVISGERKQESIKEDKKVKRVERSYGTFERRFRLPPYAKEDEIKAKLTQGVLHVTIPKNPELERTGKTIKIEGGGGMEESGGGGKEQQGMQAEQTTLGATQSSG